ncbi:MAG: ABC transporter ATP-binding protein [Planctomycetota bacterium]
MLQLEALTYTAGGGTILDGVDCTVPDAGICALLGPSGSGKTSILRAIMGLIVPQAGRCHFDGRLLSADGRALVPTEQRPFAFLFQHFTLFPHLDVKRNILIGIRDRPRSEQRSRLDELGALLRIEHLLDREIHALSGGEQQRVALARTLALDPRLLLLDEPFSNLDKMTRYQLYQDVKGLIRKRGIAAVLATHDQEEAFYFADRMLVLRDGRVQADDSPRGIYAAPTDTWLARFTGTAHCLSVAQLRLLGWSADADGADADVLYCVRPEQILLAPADQDERMHITDIAFHGFYSTVHLACGDLEISAVVLGGGSWQVGQHVQARLGTAPVRVQP